MPHDRLRVLVPAGDPVLDVVGEFFDRTVSGSLQLLGRQRREPTLDKVHPRPVGGCEVEVEPPVSEQPPLNLRGFVGRQVVQDHVDIELVGDFPVDLVEEPSEVLRGVRARDVGDPVPLAMSRAAKRSHVPLRS